MDDIERLKEAIGSAKRSDSPRLTSQPARRSPRVAPENAPDSTPTSVMPIWTVDRNLPGSDASASARREPMTFLSIIARSRAGRDDTMASSDIASRPLRTISAATIANSNMSMGHKIAIAPGERRLQEEPANQEDDQRSGGKEDEVPERKTRAEGADEALTPP